MAGVHNSLTSLTQSDAIAEVVSAESCHIVLDISPPDYVEKISRYPGSSVGQSRQDKVSNEPAEAESDSGDSLFITQKPVPEAVRSGRRPRYSLRSDPTSPRDLEESDGDTSSSASHGESKTDKERRRKKYRLPKYSFPFLSERRWKPSSTLLPVQQNISLHNSAMGGFFKCVRELWQGYQRGDNVESSLPTVDMEGDYISPLSEEEEEEEERSEDEDIKVVERKRFVAPSKAKSQQTWCNQLKQQRRRKAGNAGQETSRGRQWKTLHKTPPKASISRVTLESTHTERSDDGESSRRVLVERERKDEHVTSDGNFLAQTETPKTKRRLTRGNKKIIFQQNTGEEELCNDSDATVCEPHELQRSPRQYTQKGREASTTVTEPQTDVFHTDEPESQNLLHSLPDLVSDTNNDSVCNETRVKKRKKKKKDKGDHESVEEEKGQSQEEPEGLHAATSVDVEVDETPSLSEDNRAEPPAPQTCDELEFNEKNWVENSSHDGNILRQEERDIPDSKQKKKKRKKKSAAENVRQEVDGNLESDVRMEDSVFSVSCNVENGEKKKKKKKKKRKRSGEHDEDVEQLQSSAVTEPLNDAAEIQKKKKKRKKEERIVITEECEEEEASNRTLDLPPMSTGQMEESGNCLENTAASQETLESSYVKRKKHKKKQQSSSNDASQDGEEGVDVSFSNDAVTLAKSTGMSLKKKKKKTLSEGVDISYTPEENEKVENVDNTQKTKEGLEEQNAELVTKKKKKKKKKSEISNRNISKDNVAQSDDSVSVQEKGKKRTSSFLVADAEKNDAQTHGEQNSPSQSVDAHVWGAEKPGVRKRKRKMSVEQDGVEKDHEQDFEEPNKTCQSALPETTDTGVKRKKKRMGNESELVTPMERLESAADAGHSPTDEAAVLKKKKKKKCKDEPCHVIQESPPRKKGKHLNFPKGKRGHSAEISHDSSTSDHATKETLNMVEHASPSSETPGNQALNDMRDKKKKKKMKSADNVLPEGKSSAVPNIKSSSPMLSETSLSIMKNKHQTVKRRLHNPSEDFLTDY